MTGSEALGVWCGNRRVGLLSRRPSGAMEFQYDPAWIHEGGFAISQSLPLDSFESTTAQTQAHSFFANLLPEGEARTLVVRRYRTPDDDFELLRAIGGECAGALSILPLEQEPDAFRQFAYERIDDNRLAAMLFRRGWESEESGESAPPRLSLAGAQDKTTVMIESGEIHCPKGNAPSTHILKFDSLRYLNVLAFECFGTQLAASAGLPVVEFELRKVGRDTIALTKRYDRHQGIDGRILRLHQEDFCQALGYSSHAKYENDGGPSFVDCFRLVRDTSAAPLDDLESLLRWQIFNVLAGNSDGHAKNLSLLYMLDGAVRLAPFYDLVPTRAIQNLAHELAFAVGGVRNPGNVGPNQWRSLAAECDVEPRAVMAMVEGMAASLGAKAREARDRFEGMHGPLPALDRVLRVIDQQCRRAMRRH